MTQYIAFGPMAGICNRIKRLFSALRFYGDSNDTIDMYWSISDIVTEPFGKLFEFKTEFLINEINMQINRDEPPNNCKSIEDGNVFRLLIKEGEVPNGFTKAYPKDIEGQECIDFEFDRIPQEVRKVYLNFFRRLQPSTLVKDRIEQLNMDTKYVAVHVRLNSQWKDFGRGSDDDLKKYLDEMKKYSKDTHFFLASCDKKVADFFRLELPGQINELPNKDYEGAVDAVADLYLLSRASVLIGSYASTFTEVAWWLSGCGQQVTIIGDYETFQKNQNDQSIGRKESIKEKIIRFLKNTKG